jgi:hypothetical protein
VEDHILNLSKASAPWARGAIVGPSLALVSGLFFVSLFLPWYQQLPIISGTCAHGLFCYGPSAQVDGWNGADTVASVLAGLLFLWEGLLLTGGLAGPLPGYRSLISAALAVGALVCAAIQVAAVLTWMAPTEVLHSGSPFVWFALALAVLVGILGFVPWRVWEANPSSRIVSDHRDSAHGQG